MLLFIRETVKRILAIYRDLRNSQMFRDVPSYAPSDFFLNLIQNLLLAFEIPTLVIVALNYSTFCLFSFAFWQIEVHR